MKVNYVSVWDGNTIISTSCDYDPATKNVTNIETVEAGDLDILEREYIEFPDGTQLDRSEFLIDGEPVEDSGY
jgi:hypothetical protein